MSLRSKPPGRGARVSVSVFAPLVFVCAARIGAAQTLTIGNLLPGSPNGGAGRAGIDYASPANATGNLDTATVQVGTRCHPTSVTIKFFHPSGGVLHFLGQRGPFNITDDRQTLALSPPVAVQAGDLIGVGSADDCAYVEYQTPGAPAGFLAFQSDVTGDVPQSPAFRNTTLAVYASGQAAPGPVLVGSVVVVASVPGVPPSLFKTGFQIHNPTSSTMNVQLVFHPQGVAGSSADPTFPLDLAARETRSFDDVLPNLGLTGQRIGSLDVLTPQDTLVPVIAARVYDDAGSAGTLGFSIGMTPSEASLERGEHGVLFTPSDTTRFRMNIGARSGAQGAAITVTRRDGSGAVVQTLTKTYPANYFEQVSATTFLGGASFGANDSITIEVTGGSITVYGATVDSISEDPSLQFAARTP